MQVMVERKIDEITRGVTPDAINDHMLFTGPPGSGKTTSAKLVGEVLAELGLSNGTFAETSAARLLGDFVGRSGKNVQEALDAAKGGVLFIDEAHQLKDSEYGREIVNALIKPLSDPDDQTTVILAGYEEPMREMLAIDEGLAGRFSTTIEFPHYGTDDLFMILGDIMDSDAYKLDFANDKAEEAAYAAMADIANNPNSANVRDLQQIMLRTANNNRLTRIRSGKYKMSPEDRSKLTAADFQVARRYYKQRYPR